MGIKGGLPPGRLDARHHFPAEGFLDVGDGHRRPFLRKALGAGPANARSPAGDEGYPSL